MRKIVLILLFAASFLFTGCATASLSNSENSSSEVIMEKPSAAAVGVYDDEEKILLGPAFMNAVNHWLRRYSPTLVEQNDAYIKMTVKYEYLCNIELFIKDETYEIVVSVTQDKYIQARGQSICVRLAIGVNKSMTNSLIRGTRIRDRTARDGNR